MRLRCLEDLKKKKKEIALDLGSHERSFTSRSSFHMIARMAPNSSMSNSRPPLKCMIQKFPDHDLKPPTNGIDSSKNTIRLPIGILLLETPAVSFVFRTFRGVPYVP